MERRYKLAIPLIVFASYVTLVQLGIPQSVGVLKASNFISMTLGERTGCHFEYKYQLRWNFQCTNEERDGFRDNVASTLNFISGENANNYLFKEFPVGDDYMICLYSDSDKQLIFVLSRELTGEEKVLLETMLEDFAKGWLGIL